MIITKKLSNGITVILEDMNYLRSVSFGVWVRVGSAYENKKNNGISHMIEHMLFKGTKNRSSKELAWDTARIGGNMNAYTSKECTAYYVTTLDEHLETAIELLGDMINYSLFHEIDIEKEKGVIIEEIDMYEDSPEDMVHEMLQKNIWENHPLGYIISGEKEVVKGFTKEELICFMRDYYTSENIVLSIAGNYDEIKILDSLERNFGQIKNSSKKPQMKVPKYHRCFYTQNREMEQVHMNIAFEAIDYNSDEKYIMAIVNGFLGGSENSKLFQIIREELGLTYSIYSYSCAYEKAGLFHIDAVLNPGKIGIVYKEIMNVIEDVKKVGIKEQELIQMKEQMKIELMIDNESTKNRMNNNGKSVLNNEKIISMDEIIRNINKVTQKEVNEFMEKYFIQENASFSFVGNLHQKKIQEIKEKLHFDVCETK